VTGHLNDHEQLEALKKWWWSNGVNLLAVLIIVGGGWFGWHYWQNRSTEQAEQGSIVYMAMLDAVSAWERSPSEEAASQVSSHAEMLKKLSPGGQYGRYAALTIARLAAADGDYDNAAAELEWALAEAEDDAMRALVRLRLAGVEFARGDHDAALAWLDNVHPKAFNALYAELKGDILAAQGNSEAARVAYQAAMEGLQAGDMQIQALLQLKINEMKPGNGAAGEGEA